MSIVLLWEHSFITMYNMLHRKIEPPLKTNPFYLYYNSHLKKGSKKVIFCLLKKMVLWLFYVTIPAWHGGKIFFCFYEVWRNEKWFMWQLLTLWKLIIYNNVSFPNPTFQQIKSFPKHIFRIWCLSLYRWNAEFGILWREILTILKWINKYKLTILGWRYAEERICSQTSESKGKKKNINRYFS